jgi:hypothetical protein
MLTFRHDILEALKAAEQALDDGEILISRARAIQIQALGCLDAAQMPSRDGATSLADWTAARLAISSDTARPMVSAMRAFEHHPSSLLPLACGDFSFDRALATARLAIAGAGAVDHSITADIAGVRRTTEQRRHLTRRNEQLSFRERYLTMQPTLDISAWSLSGRLPPLEGKIVEDALDRRSDAMPDLAPSLRPSRAQRNADALAPLAQDPLAGSSDAPAGVPLVTIFVEGALAAVSAGERGAEIAADPGWVRPPSSGCCVKLAPR